MSELDPLGQSPQNSEITKNRSEPPAAPSPLKSYLGDGVYIDTDGYGLVMTTENGIDTTNTIYLEPAVLEALDRYRERIKQLTTTNEQTPTDNRH